MTSNNVDYILAFIRNVDRSLRDSDRFARMLANELEAIILDRISRGEYLAGIMASKPYSRNPIKAYKLGSASVSGQGMGKQMTINGIVIDRGDWYWGEWDAEQHGITPGNPVTEPHNFGDFTPKPVPVFIPGYEGWRTKYNGLGDTVDLSFTGSMLDQFGVDFDRKVGSNQYGGRYSFDFWVDEPQTELGYITDYYRAWLSVTEEELNAASEYIGSEIVEILMAG